ncbi:MAG: DoxX [Acidobacteriales bacterium]|nr:DoxX [Terriglobales bacterium]
MLNRKLLSNLGIRVYGVAATGLGIIGFIWGDFATLWHPVQPGVPHRTELAYIAAACLLVGGVAIQWRPIRRSGLLLLSFLYLIFSLLWVPRVIGYPQIFGTWAGFAEQFSLVAAAIIAYAQLLPRNSAWSFRTAQMGRVLFGICFVTLGLSHFFALSVTADLVPKWIPPGQRFWAILTGIAHVLAGMSMISGIQALLASRLLTTMLIGFGALVWAPRAFAYPHGHIAWAGNAINLAIIGAAWIFADSINESRLLDQE